jgi:hypothetical protein
MVFRPFAPDEDVVIVQRVSEWLAGNRDNGLWSELEREINRKSNTIYGRWKNVLALRHPELADMLADARANQIPNLSKARQRCD